MLLALKHAFEHVMTGAGTLLGSLGLALILITFVLTWATARVRQHSPTGAVGVIAILVGTIYWFSAACFFYSTSQLPAFLWIPDLAKRDPWIIMPMIGVLWTMWVLRSVPVAAWRDHKVQTLGVLAAAWWALVAVFPAGAQLMLLTASAASSLRPKKTIQASRSLAP